MQTLLTGVVAVLLLIPAAARAGSTERTEHRAEHLKRTGERRKRHGEHREQRGERLEHRAMSEPAPATAGE